MKQNYEQHRYAVVVAGGTGTRLWPMSRQNLPKQMQKFIGDRTLIDETVQRLEGVVPKENIFISTTEKYATTIKGLLPDINADNIIVEPVARGTTIAFALFTQNIVKRDPNAVIFTLASDHAVAGVEVFKQAMRNSYEFIEKHPSRIALVGIKPNRPDTGLGYIKSDKVIQKDPLAYSVEKFVEKPRYKVAKSYVESGEYYWNAAYYCFKGETLLEAYDEADSEVVKWVKAYVDSGDVEDFLKAPSKPHEIEFINAAKYPLALIPADFQWSDIGNWQSLHELLTAAQDDDLHMHSQANIHVDVDSSDCLVLSTDEKLVATVGLKDIIIVSTDDVIMVMNRNQPQKIKEVIQMLKDKHLTDYL